MVYAQKNDIGRAIGMHEQALDLRKQLVLDSPANNDFKNELAVTEIALGPLVLSRDAKRGNELLASGVSRARMLVQGDPINLDPRETLVQGLISLGRIGERAAREAALTEAVSIAEEAMRRSPQSVVWPGYLAEAHAGVAELGTSSEWKKVRDLLEPLAKSNRLPAARAALLDRARAQR